MAYDKDAKGRGGPAKFGRLVGFSGKIWSWGFWGDLRLGWGGSFGECVVRKSGSALESGTPKTDGSGWVGRRCTAHASLTRKSTTPKHIGDAKCNEML